MLVKLETYTAPKLRQALLVAVREPIYSDRAQDIRPPVEELRELLAVAEHYAGHQRWAEQVYESGGFSNGLSDRTAFRLAEQLVRVAA